MSDAAPSTEAVVPPPEPTTPATPSTEDESQGKLSPSAEEALAAAADSLDIEEDQPDLHAGDLIVRQAGKENLGECDVQEISSFSALDIEDSIKKAIAEKGWQTMSKIQRIGLPLILANPPSNLVAQAQAGTGKTGTFVIGALARITNEVHQSGPQAIILAGTQELVTQIAGEVNELGKFKGIKARRVMSAGYRKPGEERTPAPAWELQRGEDFGEQVVVGTTGMVKKYLKAYPRRKPHIDPSFVKVLIMDEADTMVQPNQFGGDTAEIRKTILRKRGSEPCQVLLFSATYSESSKELVSGYVGGKQDHSEITLNKADVTLDKVVNFFIPIGGPQDTNMDIEIKKRQAILDLWASLADHNKGQTVIFVKTKQAAAQLSEFLRGEGQSAGQIHGDMNKHEREVVFKEFLEQKRPVLVATNILSRGINNPNVTLVINVDLPVKRDSGRSLVEEADPETFVHRIGRSGRWTKRGASVSFVNMSPNSNDARIMQQIERDLFVDAGRPIIQVNDASLLGDALVRENERHKAAA